MILSMVRFRDAPNRFLKAGYRLDSQHPADWQLQPPTFRYDGHEACHRGAAPGDSAISPGVGLMVSIYFTCTRHARDLPQVILLGNNSQTSRVSVGCD